MTHKIKILTAKETMANGTYAMNMEIEMLKKELAKEGDRLRRIQNGEKVSPPRVSRILIGQFWPKNLIGRNFFRIFFSTRKWV